MKSFAAFTVFLLALSSSNVFAADAATEEKVEETKEEHPAQNPEEKPSS